MNQSRQFSFINNQHGFSLSFIEGSSLMAEVNKIHNIGPMAQSFYKQTILGSTQLIKFLKPGETLGFYIDSEEPYFRFKIEMSQHGTFRTLLLPEDFDEFPTTFTGKARVTKLHAGKSPYSSIIDYKDFTLEDIPNEIIDKSYQTNSKVILSKETNNSLMITKLPPTNINKKIEDFDDIKMPDFILKYAPLIDKVFQIKTSDVAIVESIFNEYDFNYIGSKAIKFDCPCSKERMVQNLHHLKEEDRLELFVEKNIIETRCDYCNTVYAIETKDLITKLQ